MTGRNAKKVWIALVELRQRPGANVLLDRNMAFTNVLALASNVEELQEVARAAAERLGFDLMALEEPEPFAERNSQYSVHADIKRLAHEVAATGETRFGAFYTWISND